MVIPINTLDGPLDVLRENEVNLLMDVAGSLAEMGEDAQQDRRRLLDVAQDLRELFFLVVIIGEFNAGKSTFVNALLGEDLLPMGITPTTEKVELVRYSETPNRAPILRSDSLREWAHPSTGAPGVAIVDTPGTGSVFRKHETVAKEFLHRSDLVIFLISAKRAFAETERIYLETAKNYGKKVILVVNQVDLLQPNEQAEVRRFVEQQVRELLDLQPLVFMVSAKKALAAQKDGETGEVWGMDAVRAHLRGVFSETPVAKQKLLSQLDLAQSIVRRHYDAVNLRVNMVTSDTTKVRDVRSELEKQSIGLSDQLTQARDEVDRVFEGIRQRGVNFLDTHLTVRLLSRAPSRERLQAEFQETVVGRAMRDINEATNGYVNAVVDHSRMYWRGVIERLSQLQELMEQEVGGLDAGVYAQQREGLQEAIRIAEAELRSYSTGSVVDEIHASFETNLNGFKSSLVAAFGGWVLAVVAIATPGPLIGAGAAALALPALVVAAPFAAFGSYAAYRYYRRITSEIKQDFSGRVEKLMENYHAALDELTAKERKRLAQYGTQVLTPIFSRLETLLKRYSEQHEQLQGYLDRISNLRQEIERTR